MGVRHLPDLTILHHAGKAGWNPKLEAQGAYAKRPYMWKHFSPPHRLAATTALSPLATACAPLHGRRNVSGENVHAPPSALFSVVDRLLTGSHHASRFVLNSAGVRKSNSSPWRLTT